jgi:hypothetical protein
LIEEDPMTDGNDIERAVAAYRAEVVAEAELGHADLAEIEDHLRALIDELRASGLPAAQAVTEAARRLGEPRAVAREHARVRTTFGARLSRMRTWSVVALMLPLLASALPHIDRLPWNFVFNFWFHVVLAIAFATRRTWTRPILLGGYASSMGWSVASVLTHPEIVHPHWGTVAVVGLLAFLVPWRRGEMSRAGVALALTAFASGAAAIAMGWIVDRNGNALNVAPAGAYAFILSIVATVGGVLRARWSTFASTASAVALAVAVVQVATLRFRVVEPAVVATLALIASGAVAAAVAAALSWRSASSRLGTLRHLAA